MAKRKPRKSAYIPPTNEVENRKERSYSETRSSKGSSGSRPNPRGEYIYPTPSIKRTMRRLPLYFILIFGLQYFIGVNQVEGTQQKVVAALFTALFITIAFAPFMHIMDKWSYNRWLKRTGRTAPSKDANGTVESGDGDE